MFHFPGSLSSDQVAHLRNLVDSSNIGARVYFFAASGFKYSDNRDIPRDFDARQQDAIYVMLEYWQDPREEQEQNGPGGAWLDEDGMEVALAEHLEKERRKIGCSKIVVKHVKFNTIDYLLEEVPEEAEGQDTTFMYYEPVPRVPMTHEEEMQIYEDVYQKLNACQPHPATSSTMVANSTD
jgi:hypothetical protein